MGRITVFKDIKDTKNPHHVDVNKAVTRIREGKSKSLVDRIRHTEDSSQRHKLKAGLPSYCFSGEFSERKIAGLVKHSGLVCLDFDHLNGRLKEFKERLSKNEFIHAAFVSPSGDGLKVLVKIPASEKTHARSCKALASYFCEETLDNFEDVSRVCYESWDPDIYYNPKSRVFEKLADKLPETTTAPAAMITDSEEVIDNLVTWLDKKETYQDGNKHKYLVKLAAACNRFGVSEHDAAGSLVRRYQRETAPSKDIEKIVKDVYRNYTQDFGRSSFEATGTPIDRVTRKPMETPILELPVKDIILLDAVEDTMLSNYHNGRSMGETTHFPTLDEHFRWKRGELTLMHGIANHGKTTALLHLCLIKAVKDGYKYAVFSPEQFPPDDFYDDLVHSYIGKNTQPQYDDQMTEAEYRRGMKFVKEHFFYIYPESEAPTPEYIMNCFEAAIEKYKVDGCIIDPYNQLDNDLSKAGYREDQYLSRVLTKTKRFAQTHDIFMMIITHPKSGLRKNDLGDYEVPDVFDLSGGAMWSNKCDNILYTHRPMFSSHRGSSSVVIGSQKIKKQNRNGKPGDTNFEFDYRSMRFIDIAAGKIHPLEETEPENEIPWTINNEAPF